MSIKNYEKLSNGNLQKRYEFLTKEESTNFYTTSGTGTEYTVSVPYINELSDGVSIKVKFHTDSSANCYLNVNSLGKRRLMIDTSTVATTEFKAGSYCTLIYNSSISSSIAQNPNSATGGWVLQYSNSGGGSSTAEAISYTTTAPSANNPTGLKFVILEQEPATRYSGYYYIITGGSGEIADEALTASEINSMWSGS